MYYLGCDQHKKYSYVVVKDQKGNTLNQAKLYHADTDEVKNYFLTLPQGSLVGLEASGFKFLACRAIKNG